MRPDRKNSIVLMAEEAIKLPVTNTRIAWMLVIADSIIPELLEEIERQEECIIAANKEVAFLLQENERLKKGV